MRKPAPSPRLVEDLSGLLQGYPVPRGRARALARELEFLNAEVRSAARRIAFEDEPSQFDAVLRAGPRRRPAPA